MSTSSYIDVTRISIFQLHEKQMNEDKSLHEILSYFEIPHKILILKFSNQLS